MDERDLVRVIKDTKHRPRSEKRPHACALGLSRKVPRNEWDAGDGGLCESNLYDGALGCRQRSRCSDKWQLPIAMRGFDGFDACLNHAGL